MILVSAYVILIAALFGRHNPRTMKQVRSIISQQFSNYMLLIVIPMPATDSRLRSSSSVQNTFPAFRHPVRLGDDEGRGQGVALRGGRTFLFFIFLAPARTLVSSSWASTRVLTASLMRSATRPPTSSNSASTNQSTTRPPISASLASSMQSTTRPPTSLSSASSIRVRSARRPIRVCSQSSVRVSGRRISAFGLWHVGYGCMGVVQGATDDEVVQIYSCYFVCVA